MSKTVHSTQSQSGAGYTDCGLYVTAQKRAYGIVKMTINREESTCSRCNTTHTSQREMRLQAIQAEAQS